MLFCVVAIDKPDCLALRMATRDAHFAYARETGVIKLGGPFLDSNGDMAGSLIVFEADSLEAALSWHRADPYMKANLFTHSDVRPWKPTVNNCEAKF